MKKLILLCTALFLAAAGKAQLTGVKTIPGDYPDLGAAITALNSAGVGAGGVTFLLNANQTTAGGYTITATGTAANPIVINGNTKTISATGTAGSADAIFALAGSDYVTITNCVMTGDNTVEWGVLLAKKNSATPLDGAQNNTVTANTITLDRTNANSIGIYAAHINPGSTTTLTTTGLVAGDANSLNLVGTNTISNVYTGILFTGAGTSAGYDAGNSILTNAVSNFGGSGANVFGIRVQNYNSVTISNNNVQNAGSTSVTAYGIQVGAGTGTATIGGNTVKMTSSSTGSALYGIGNTGTTATAVNVTNNIISNCDYSGAASGAFSAIINNVTATGLAAFSATGNTVSNNTLGGTGSMLLIDGGVAASITLSNNIISGNTKSGASGTLACIRTGNGNNITSITASGNTITNNTIPASSGTGACLVYGIFAQGTMQTGFTETYSGNTITGLSAAGATTSNGCNIYGIYPNPSSISVRTISNNVIGGFSNIGGGNVFGINNGQGFDNLNLTATSNFISANKIYDLSGTSANSAVSGIYNSAGRAAYLVNNLIGNLEAPAAFAGNPVNGINIQGGGPVSVVYNTVFLNTTSTGLTFGSSAINASSSQSLLLQNNIFINLSTSTGAGYTVAYRRSGTSLTTYDNASNNNIFYAGTPGAFRLIFYDGTNSDQTLAAFKTRVAPRDAASQTENTPFISTTGSAASFLHISPTATTLAANGGIAIAGVSTDFDNDARDASTPDIGADEFSTSTCAAPGTPVASAITGNSATLTWPGAAGTTGYNWELRTGGSCGSGAPVQSGNTGSATVNLGSLVAGTTYTFCVQNNCGSGSLSTWSSATFATTAPCTVSITQQPTSASACAGSPASFTVAATSTGALTYQWRLGGSPISGATSATYSIANTTPADAGNYDVVVSAAGCGSVTSNTVSLLVNAVTAITVQPLGQTVCPGSNVSLFVNANGTNLTYQWQKAGSNIGGANAATLTLNNVSSTDAAVYRVQVTGACGAVQSSDALIDVAQANTWIGTVSTDWNTASNWCGGVPTSTSNMIIPAGTPFSPILNSVGTIGNLTIASGATLTLSGGSTLNVSGNLQVNGTLNAGSGTVGFLGASQQTVSGFTAGVVNVNGAGIALNGNLNITNALNLIQGNVTLGSFNVTLAGGAAGTASSHVITNGTGAVIVNNVGAFNMTAPVGPNATSYNPVTIGAGSGRNFSVRVVTGFSHPIAWPANAVNRTWTITPSAASATPANYTFGYADADANAAYNPLQNMEVGAYVSGNWVIVTPAGGVGAGGGSSLRLVTTTTTSSGEMVVGNTGSILLVTATPTIDSDLLGVQLLPNVVNNSTVLRVQVRRAMTSEWVITNAAGRTVQTLKKQLVSGTNDIRLTLADLASGVYFVKGTGAKGALGTLRFVKQ